MDSPIKNYYENLATTYDENRFANSYGQFIDHQERQILNRWIQKQATILDIGCGTGRFLEYATHGLDVSQNMLNEAQRKFPEKKLVASSATNTPFEKAIGVNSAKGRKAHIKKKTLHPPPKGSGFAV